MRLPELPEEFELGKLGPREDPEEPNDRYPSVLLLLDEDGRFELPLEKEPEGRATLLRGPELLLKLPFVPRVLLGCEKLCHPFWF